MVKIDRNNARDRYVLLSDICLCSNIRAVFGVYSIVQNRQYVLEIRNSIKKDKIK